MKVVAKTVKPIQNSRSLAATPQVQPDVQAEAASQVTWEGLKASTYECSTSGSGSVRLPTYACDAGTCGGGVFSIDAHEFEMSISEGLPERSIGQAYFQALESDFDQHPFLDRMTLQGPAGRDSLTGPAIVEHSEGVSASNYGGHRSPYVDHDFTRLSADRISYKYKSGGASEPMVEQTYECTEK